MARPCAPLLLLLLLSISIAVAKPSSKPPPPAARKDDIKYIRCAVCNEIAKQLSLQATKKRQEVAPKQLSEYQIIELAENICNLKRTEGDWLLHQDIVEDGDKLLLVGQKDEGECKTECKTIEKACQEVMGYLDTDVAEFMFKKSADTDKLSEFLCKDLSKSCRGKIPPVPKDRIPGEPFFAKSSKDAEIERIMRSMSDMPGAPGMKMYSKDDLMNGMPNFDGDDEDEDDEDEEEISTKENKARVKEKTLDESVHRLLSAMKQRTEQAILSIRKHIKKASDWFGKWWSGKPKVKSSKSGTAEL